MDKEKDYSNLHRGLVLRYFWQVVKRFKISFFTVIISTIITAGLDIYIPLQFLKLWNVLSSNSFDLIVRAQHIVILIFILGFIRLIIKRSSGFLNSYFQANVLAGLRKQSFSYMIGHAHSFFADNFGGSLTQKINKYAKAFQRLMDMLVDNGIPLIIRSIGTVIAIYTLIPKYAYILAIFCFVFLVTALIYTRCKLKYDVMAALSDTKTTGALADSISNHSSIQLFAGHQHEELRVGKVIDNQKDITSINWYLWDGLIFIQSFYIIIIEFIIFWTAINDWKYGLITLPIIVLLQSYLGRLSENLWSFAGIVRVFYDSFSDAQEMALILDTPYGIQDSKNLKILKQTKGEVVFDNVTYIYI